MERLLLLLAPTHTQQPRPPVNPIEITTPQGDGAVSFTLIRVFLSCMCVWLLMKHFFQMFGCFLLVGIVLLFVVGHLVVVNISTKKCLETPK